MSIAILACPSLLFATDGVIENATGVEHREGKITEERIEQVLEENLDACIVDESDTKLPLEVVNVEVDKIGSAGLLSSNESTIYAAKAKVKTAIGRLPKERVLLNVERSTGDLIIQVLPGRLIARLYPNLFL